MRLAKGLRIALAAAALLAFAAVVLVLVLFPKASGRPPEAPSKDVDSSTLNPFAAGKETSPSAKAPTVVPRARIDVREQTVRAFLATYACMGSIAPDAYDSTMKSNATPELYKIVVAGVAADPLPAEWPEASSVQYKNHVARLETLLARKNSTVSFVSLKPTGGPRYEVVVKVETVSGTSVRPVVETYSVELDGQGLVSGFALEGSQDQGAEPAGP